MNKKLDLLLANAGDMALKRRARRIIEGLELKNGDKILDVGCGDGFYLHLLSNLGLKLDLTGTDFDTAALKSAKKNLGGKKIPLIQADLMDKLPFKNNTFDKIVMSEVAEHLPDDLRGLREVYRVLKPKGILVLTVPNHNYPFLWDPLNKILETVTGQHIKSGFWAGIWNQHLRLYKPKEIERVIKEAGFKVEKLESVTFWCLPFNHNLINFTARMLYGGNLSPDIALAVSKYETRDSKPLLIKIVFKTVNLIDKLNNIYQPKNHGVGVFVRAIK